MNSQMLSRARPIPAATTWDWRLPCLRALVLLLALLIFAARSPAYSVLKDNTRWQAVLLSLDQLKLVGPAPTLASSPAQQSPLVSN